MPLYKPGYQQMRKHCVQSCLYMGVCACKYCCTSKWRDLLQHLEARKEGLGLVLGSPVPKPAHCLGLPQPRLGAAHKHKIRHQSRGRPGHRLMIPIWVDVCHQTPPADKEPCFVSLWRGTNHHTAPWHPKGGMG